MNHITREYAGEKKSFLNVSPSKSHGYTFVCFFGIQSLEYNLNLVTLNLVTTCDSMTIFWKIISNLLNTVLRRPKVSLDRDCTVPIIVFVNGTSFKLSKSKKIRLSKLIFLRQTWSESFWKHYHETIWQLQCLKHLIFYNDAKFWQGIQQVCGQNFAIFWPLPPPLRGQKQRTFDPLPRPHFVHVIIEWPLMSIQKIQ